MILRYCLMSMVLLLYSQIPMVLLLCSQISRVSGYGYYYDQSDICGIIIQLALWGYHDNIYIVIDILSDVYSTITIPSDIYDITITQWTYLWYYHDNV